MSDSFAIFGVKLPSSDSASAPRSVEILVMVKIFTNYQLRITSDGMQQVYSLFFEDKGFFLRHREPFRHPRANECERSGTNATRGSRLITTRSEQI